MNDTTTTKNTAITFFENVGAICKMLCIGINMERIEFAGKRMDIAVTNESFAALWSHLPEDPECVWTVAVTQLFPPDLPRTGGRCTIVTLTHELSAFRTTFWGETMDEDEVNERLTGLLNSSPCRPSGGEESSGGKE